NLILTEVLQLLFVNLCCVFQAWALETGKYQDGVDEPTRPSGRQTCAALSTRARVSAEIRRHQETRSDVQIYEVCEQLGSTGESTLESCGTGKNHSNRSLKESTQSTNRMKTPPLPSWPEEPGPQTVPKVLQDKQSITDLSSSDVMWLLTDLDLKFQYRGRTAGSLTVSNLRAAEQVDLFGPVSCSRSWSKTSTPSASVSVKCSGLDRARWNTVHEPLEREKKIKVFSLNEFLQELILFHKGETQSPPPFEISFCFGEDWPDKKPEKRNSSWSGVVPVVARILTEMFSGELSWSTDSIRLLQSQHIQGPWTPPSLNTWTLFSPD
uniref:Interferon regulatory factor 5 n=1 Tax=Labrus bergylta TaxID=56723 RepID=A0A3Q3LQM9_9LABR